MNNIAFDTHEFVEGLTRAKMPKSQAEFLAKTYANLLNNQLATKDDLKHLEQRLESRMTVKFLLMQITTIVILIGAMNYFN